MRVKESDRIQVMQEGLAGLGVEAEALPDGMIIKGGEMLGGTVDSYGDHRIAMAFAMAGLRANDQIRIADCENVDTSFPEFVELAAEVGLKVSESS